MILHQHCRRLRGAFGRRADSGMVLVTVIWIVIILSVLAVSLSRSVGVDLALLNYETARLRSYEAARAGIIYIFSLIRNDVSNDRVRAFDMVYGCGLTAPDGQRPEDLLKDVPVGDETSFDISYSLTDSAASVGEDFFGIADEERRINLNAITLQNSGVLEQLIVNLGFDDAVAKTVALAVVDWHDADNIPGPAPFGAEDQAYRGLPKSYAAKNRPFDRVEELCLVKGMTAEIFQKLRDDVTVYPKQPARLWVNLNTASSEVLEALADEVAASTLGLDRAAAAPVVAKIVAYRRGEDAVWGTTDDRPLPTGGNIKSLFDFTSSEAHLYEALAQRYNIGRSNIFRVRSLGRDRRTGVRATIEAVVSKDSLTVLSWERD